MSSNPFPRGGSQEALKSSSDVKPLDALFGKKRTRTVEVVETKSKKKKSAAAAAIAAEIAPIAPIVKIGLGMTKMVNNKVVRIDALSFSKYSTGSLVFGYILQLTDTCLVVSLPGGLTGTVALDEISDVLFKASRESKHFERPITSSLVSVFQPIVCYILEKQEESRKLILSMRSSLVNRGIAFKHLAPGFPISGCISSIEDHGYLVSTGIAGSTCFLPFKATPSSWEGSCIGKPVDCLVEALNDGARTVTLRAHRKAVVDAITRGTLLSFNSLIPGMLLNVTVDRIVENGIVVSFLGSFFGVIDELSLPRLCPTKEWQAGFVEGDVLQARVVYADHGGKSARLSLRPHVIELRTPKNLPALGTILEDLSVISTNKKVGVHLVLDTTDAQTEKEGEDEAEGVKGRKQRNALALKKKREADESRLGVFVHRSSLASGEATDANTKKCADPDQIERIYKVGTSVDAVRTCGYHLVEGLALGSNMEANLRGEVVHWTQVSVGQVVTAIVTAIRDVGLVVKVNDKVRALCPLQHLADTVMSGKMLPKKFKVGMKLKVRVWEMNGSSIIVTNKKSLVDDQGTIISSFEETEVGQAAAGVVSQVSEEGLRVHFYNSVKGFIPTRVLMQQGVMDATESYRVGQLVRCVVVRKLNPREHDVKGKSRKNATLLLGLELGEASEVLAALADEMRSSNSVSEEKDDEEEEAESASKSVAKEDKAKLAAGELLLVSGVITRLDEDALNLLLDDGRHATLHHTQCYDLAATAERMFATGAVNPFSVGGRIEHALVIGFAKKGILLVSIKPLLLTVAALSVTTGKKKQTTGEQISIPSRAGDLSAGQIVAGFVHKVEVYGVLVKFLDSFTALAPRPNIADKFVATPVGMFNVGDSIRCVVQRVDLETEKVIVTFKSALVPPSLGDYQYTHALLREQALSSSKSSSWWGSNVIGAVVEATVVSVKPDAVTLKGQDGTKLVARGPHADKTVKVGAVVSVRVLDLNLAAKEIDVSMLVTLVSAIAVQSEKKTKKKAAAAPTISFTQGDKLQVCVQLVKEHYLIASAFDGRRLVCVAVADYHCPFLANTDIKSQQIITAKIDRVPSTASCTSPHDELAFLSIYAEQQDQQRTAARGKGVNVKESPEALSETHTSNDFSDLRVGCMLTWEIVEITALELKLVPPQSARAGGHIKAVVHVTGAIDVSSAHDNLEVALAHATGDRNAIGSQHPFFGLTVGQTLAGKAIQIRKLAAKAPAAPVAGKRDQRGASKVTSAQASEEAALGETLVYLSISPTKDTSVAPSSRLLQWQGSCSVKQGHTYVSVVTKIEPTHVTVALSPYITSRLHFLDISNTNSTIKKFHKSCFVGQRVTVTITQLDNGSSGSKHQKTITVSRVPIESTVTSTTDVSLIQNDKLVYDEEVAVKAGQLVLGILDLKARNVPRPPAVMVSLAGNQQGRVCATELSDREDWMDLTSLAGDHASLPDGRKHGDLVRCRVMAVSDHHFDLTLRESRLACKNKSEAITADPLPTEGDLVKGFVSNTSSKGCFVRLSSSLTGMVFIKDLADEFIADPVAEYPMGKLVEARLLSVSQTNSTAKLSLKVSAVVGDVKTLAELATLSEGDTVVGKVERITDFGVFVAIDNTSLVGLSRKAAAIVGEGDLTASFEVGDVVRAKVLSVSAATKKIGLGLKPSFFREDGQDDDEDDEEEQDEDDDDDEEEDNEDDDEVDEDCEDDSDDDINAIIKAASIQVRDDSEDEEDDNEDEEAEEDDEEEVEVVVSSRKAKKAKTAVVVANDDSDSDDDALGRVGILSGGAKSAASSVTSLWGDFQPVVKKAVVAVAGSDEDSDEEEVHGAGSKRTRQKESKKRKEEESVRDREASLLDGSLVPDRAGDFERLLLAEPNSSFLWIQYVAFHLSSADVDAARGVAERALRTISFREEDEKFNVWMALLNVEHKYGDMSTLENVFKRAVAESKGKIIHMNMVEVYEQAGDVKAAETMLEKTLKKYKYSKKVWSAYQLFRIRRGDDKGAKELLARSMQSLSRHKHVEVIEKFALGEFDFGSADRGRVVFEELVNSYPKRTDLWHVFVDKEVKLGNFDQARQLFERMITTKTSTGNMKTIFKKYLAFEVANGTKDQQDIVKQRARDYVQSML